MEGQTKLNDKYEFDATITYCRFYNTDSLWGVYRFSTKHNLPYLDDPSFSDIASIDGDDNLKFGSLVGKMQELDIGCKYHIIATLNKSKYGWEYNPENIFAVAPKSTEDQKLFLCTLVNEKVAKNILDKYPNIVNDIINGDIVDIDYSDIRGVAKKTWEKIKDKIISNYMVSDIIIMLRPLGVNFNTIKSLLKMEKNAAVLKKKIESNPYILTRLKGYGFKRVDNFAIKLRPDIVTSVERLTAFLRYFFRELGESSGDTWTTVYELSEAVRNAVPECEVYLNDVLNNSNIFVLEDNHVGLNVYKSVEYYIHGVLRSKNNHPNFIYIPQKTIDSAIKEAEKIQGFTYSKEQVEVINNVLKSNVSIIAGKAGVGKSSIMRAIMIALKRASLKFDSCALSAMAAKRIEEASGFSAKTIHRTLGCKGDNKFEYDENNKIPINVLIVDEGSMVGASLFYFLFQAIRDDTVVIISGDNKQLPPIGYGNIFSDLIDTLDPTCVNLLTKPMRQAQESGILVDANKIRENIDPITESPIPKIIHGNLQDMYYMFRNDRDTLTRIAIKTYLGSIKTDGMDDVVIITPRKQGCENSSTVINQKIQYILMKDRPDSQKITCSNNTSKMFYLGDRVIQTVNNYADGIFNGDIGYVTSVENHVDDKGKVYKTCKITFNNVKDYDGKKKELNYQSNELDDIELAYALTCHKIQGAGIKTVIGIIDNTHYTLLDNCMLYTMMTRAKKRCLLLAEPTAFQACIRKSHNNRRTWLSIENNKVKENA